MNNELYESIKSMLADGITAEDITKMVNQIEAEREQEAVKVAKAKEQVIARECLINAVISYCKVLGIADDLKPEDINELRKSLTMIETSLQSFKTLMGDPNVSAVMALFNQAFEPDNTPDGINEEKE